MTRTQFQTFESLEKQLISRLDGKFKKTAVMAGHYPLDRFGQSATRPCDYDSFGIFSVQTLHMGSRIVRAGKEKGKDIGLVLLIDDHSQQKDNEWYAHTDNQAIQIRQNVEEYFRNFQMPDHYLNIMAQYGLTEADIIPSQFGLPFQESKYREMFAEKFPGQMVGCAGEYHLFLEELGQKEIQTIIAFIPQRCQGPTCNAVGQYRSRAQNPKMKTVNIYMLSENGLDSPQDLLAATIDGFGGITVITEG